MFTMEPEELRERNVERIPETLGDAIEAYSGDVFMKEVDVYKRQVSCYTVNLYILKGVADGGGIGGACVLYGLDGSQVGIVTQSGDSRDNVFLLFLYQIFLEALDEGRSLVVSRFRLVRSD